MRVLYDTSNGRKSNSFWGWHESLLSLAQERRRCKYFAGSKPLMFLGRAERRRQRNRSFRSWNGLGWVRSGFGETTRQRYRWDVWIGGQRRSWLWICRYSQDIVENAIYTIDGDLLTSEHSVQNILHRLLFLLSAWDSVGLARPVRLIVSCQVFAFLSTKFDTVNRPITRAAPSASNIDKRNAKTPPPHCPSQNPSFSPCQSPILQSPDRKPQDPTHPRRRLQPRRPLRHQIRPPSPRRRLLPRSFSPPA